MQELFLTDSDFWAYSSADMIVSTLGSGAFGKVVKCFDRQA